MEDMHKGCEHRKTLAADHAQDCPVRKDGMVARYCTCHYSDARCQEIGNEAKCVDHPSEGGHPDDVCGWCSHCLRCGGGQWDDHLHGRCHAPGERRERLTVEYLDVVGHVIATRTFPEMGINEMRNLITTFTFAFSKTVHAARITSGSRKVLHRRPVQAYGPGHLPRVYPNPVREAQQRRVGL